MRRKSIAILAASISRCGQIPEAVESLLKAVALKENDPQAHFHLGLALERQGRIPDAVYALRQAVALAPKLAEAHARLARLMRDLGDRSAAI